MRQENPVSILEIKSMNFDIDINSCLSTGTEKKQQLFDKALNYTNSSADLKNTITFNARKNYANLSSGQKFKQEILEIFLKHYTIPDFINKTCAHLDKIFTQSNNHSRSLYNSTAKLIISCRLFSKDVFLSGKKQFRKSAPLLKRV